MRLIRLASALFLGILVGVVPVHAAEIGAVVPPQTGAVQSDTNATTLPAAAATVSMNAAHFDDLARSALATMQKKAEALHVGGVAVVAYCEGEKVESWSSRMVVVGRLKDEPNGAQKGSNLLAIAYAKAAEMADTLKNSGSQARPPMTGEFGWEGGLIVRLKSGYLIAAFSGGESADDVAISRTGLAEIVGQLRGAP